MKSIMLLILLTSSLLMASQNTLQYQGREGPVQLPVAPDRITVMVDSSRFTNWESILTSDASIDPSKEPEKLWGGFYVVHLSDGVDPLSVVAHLYTRQDVAFAYPVFSNPRGEDVYITNHVVVHFNEAVSLDQIDSIRSARGLIPVLTLFRNPRYQSRPALSTAHIKACQPDGMYLTARAATDSLAAAKYEYVLDCDGYCSASKA